ncbi:MAG: alginate lyase family protein [Chitinophaga sp.]|uniref:alginate lyase family protein n=1 Tax=Chitinophaga sp. TaxID=1869181 RepID=UPI001B2681A3|nr:alginate lyase family protein [Chitinophaga sp.]MBO9729788.1 alginate lyase family protein [Chitinophaga sp.]
MSTSAQTPAFVHPGLLHSREDLRRMGAAVAQQRSPIYEGFLVFKESPFSHCDYQLKGPLREVGRNPSIGHSDYDSDANAAYQNAVMWAITGDKRYAQTAIRIIDAWSDTLQSVIGRDAVLMAGLGPFKMVNAAEIMRYSDAGWSAAAVKRTEQHFLRVIYPVIAEYAPFANGNWDDAALKTVMAIGIFCNDHEIFEKAVRYYVNGWGNGSLTHYIINDEGQVQETGRDQAHTQLGIGMLAECCEMAWHQGLDLYAYANNRLLKGFEYTAKYNLGYNDIPYTPMIDRTGKYRHTRPSEAARGKLRAVYEQVYNHYVNRMGLPAPFTKAAADKLRPEGPGTPGADHPGYGTLFYTISPVIDKMDTVNFSVERPAGLVLRATTDTGLLTWVSLRGASSYVIRRAENKKGHYVKAGVTAGNFFRDSSVKEGVIFYYTVTGIQDGRESAASLPVSLAGGGLPLGWHNTDIGNTETSGYAQYDGNELRIEAGGRFTDSLPTALNYTYRKLKKNEEVIIRVCPQPSSQFTAVGLMIRSNQEPASTFAAWMLYPGKAKDIEAPQWMVQLMQRKQPGAAVAVLAQQPLREPAVTYGRLTGAYWLKVTRSGNLIKGCGSYNGIDWEELGTIDWPARRAALIGVGAAANISGSTTVRVRM